MEGYIGGAPAQGAAQAMNPIAAQVTAHEESLAAEHSTAQHAGASPFYPTPPMPSHPVSHQTTEPAGQGGPAEAPAGRAGGYTNPVAPGTESVCTALEFPSAHAAQTGPPCAACTMQAAMQAQGLAYTVSAWSELVEEVGNVGMGSTGEPGCWASK